VSSSEVLGKMVPDMARAKPFDTRLAAE